MASGIIYGSTGNQYIDSKIEWSSTANNSANTSSVTASLYYKRNNTGFTTQGTGSFTININGQTTSASKHITITESDWVLAITATKTVSHNDDGTKSIAISASGSIPNTTLSSTSCSSRVNLDSIARASTLTSAANKTLGTACSIKWTPLSKSFRYKLKFTLGGFTYTTEAIHPNTISAYTYTGYDLPIADIAPKITGKPPTGTMTVELYTYSDSEAKTQVGSASSKTFTVTVPNNDDTKPSVGMSLTSVNSLGSKFSSLYIQGKCKVKATITGDGEYSANITSKVMYVDGKDNGTLESAYLSKSGGVTVKGRVYDSRGYYNEAEEVITVIPYGKPSLLPADDESDIICARCDENGKLTESGTHLKIKAKRNYSPVIVDNVQKNFCQIRYRYKAEGGVYSSWMTALASDSMSSNVVESNALLNGALSVKTVYYIQLQAIDDIGEQSSTITIPIPTDNVYMHRAGSINSLGIGEYVDDENTVSLSESLTLRVRGGFASIGIIEGSDLNDLIKPNNYIGFYSHSLTYLNCPLKEKAAFALEVINFGVDGQALQRLTVCSAEATVYERQYFSSKWHDWECVNPPMKEGVEYRTKERYLGKAVYTKIVKLDSLPNATNKKVAHGANSTQVIRCVGQMSDGNSLPFHYTSTNWVEIYAGNTYIVVLTGDNKTSFTAYAQMWYLKD